MKMQKLCVAQVFPRALGISNGWNGVTASRHHWVGVVEQIEMVLDLETVEQIEMVIDLETVSDRLSHCSTAGIWGRIEERKVLIDLLDSRKGRGTCQVQHPQSVASAQLCSLLALLSTPATAGLHSSGSACICLARSERDQTLVDIEESNVQHQLAKRCTRYSFLL